MTRPALSFLRSPAAQLLVLTLGHLIVDTYSGLVQPLIPELCDRLDVRLSAMTALVGVGHLVVNAVQPVAGMLASRLSRPYLMMIGPLLATAVALLGFPHSFAWMVVVLMTAQVGIGMFHPDGLLAAHNVSGARGRLGVPVFLSGGYFGFSLGALVATQWVEHKGFSGFWTLAAGGIVLVGLFALTGLHRLHTRSTSDRHRILAGPPMNFWLVLSLAILTITMHCVLFMFLRVELKHRWPETGGAYGGYALALLGLVGAVGGYLWGHLSARFSRYGLIAFGQMACVPLYLLFLRASSETALLLWSLPLGLCLGGAMFPLLATASRDCPQLNPNLRAGIIMGGSWGAGSLFAMGCGWLTDFGITVGQFLPWMVAPVLLAAAMATVLYRMERRLL